jgi:hypothetical protein
MSRRDARPDDAEHLAALLLGHVLAVLGHAERCRRRRVARGRAGCVVVGRCCRCLRHGMEYIAEYIAPDILKVTGRAVPPSITGRLPRRPRPRSLKRSAPASAPTGGTRISGLPWPIVRCSRGLESGHRLSALHALSRAFPGEQTIVEVPDFIGRSAEI